MYKIKSFFISIVLCSPLWAVDCFVESAKSSINLTSGEICYLKQRQVSEQLAKDLDAIFAHPDFIELFDEMRKVCKAHSEPLKLCVICKDIHVSDVSKEDFIAVLLKHGFIKMKKSSHRCVFSHVKFPHLVFKFSLCRNNIHRIKFKEGLQWLIAKYKNTELAKMPPVFLPEKNAYCIPLHGMSLDKDKKIPFWHIVVVAQKMDLTGLTDHTPALKESFKKVLQLARKEKIVQSGIDANVNNACFCGNKIVWVDTGFYEAAQYAESDCYSTILPSATSLRFRVPTK